MDRDPSIIQVGIITLIFTLFKVLDNLKTAVILLFFFFFFGQLSVSNRIAQFEDWKLVNDQKSGRVNGSVVTAAQFKEASQHKVSMCLTYVVKRIGLFH